MAQGQQLPSPLHSCPYIGQWRPIAANLLIGTRCGHLGQLLAVARYLARGHGGTLRWRVAPTSAAAVANENQLQ